MHTELLPRGGSSTGSSIVLNSEEPSPVCLSGPSSPGEHVECMFQLLLFIPAV